MRSFFASLLFLGFASYSGIRGQEVTVPHRFRTSYQNGHDTVRYMRKGLRKCITNFSCAKIVTLCAFLMRQMQNHFLCDSSERDRKRFHFFSWRDLRIVFCRKLLLFSLMTSFVLCLNISLNFFSTISNLQYENSRKEFERIY